ncbi:cobalt ECF transporter T component CbiQ [Thermococcus peptonophilus]|uniref:Cobalt ECF transporter T component CbiQ n=1 Tax=Thermococcus peptonophilus TaxID=53952 RepID=A0A142CXB1_9EURY|nr:cobalt ECF transporter T component CbiQ [Thermococcus peptonophilus]AMQ19413.1 hypothetical protein A0127_09700 [Thermococcus peptonophilus]
MGLLEETAKEVLQFTTEAVFSERYAREDGLLQKADPRVRFFSLFVLVSTVVFLRSFTALLVFYTVPLLLSYFSKVKLGDFVKRVWVFVPIFTGIIAAPSMFMVPGKPLLTIPHTDITLTWEGLRWAVLFTLRVATAVSYAVLFTMTSRWNEVLSALSSFKVPGMVITIATLAYRYTFLLSKLLLDSMHARRARLAGDLGMVESWKEAGKHIGATFIKASALGEEVYYAMLSRGYKNEVPPVEGFKIEAVDYLIISLTAFLLLFGVIATKVGLP